MSLYGIEYRRILKWFIIGAVANLLILLSLFLFYEAIYDTTFIESYDATSVYDDPEYSAGHIFILLSPYLLAIAALGLMGRGTTRGWRNTDLSMPVSKRSHGGKIYGYALKLLIIGLSSIVLFMIIFSLRSVYAMYPDVPPAYRVDLNDAYIYVIVSQVISVLYAVIIFGLMSPSLASGFYRGSWGWWAFFLLPLPLLVLIPYYIVNPVAYIGVSSTYAIPFALIAPVAILWGYLNTRWYFRKKPDF
jgi:hypothetical protein